MPYVVKQYERGENSRLMNESQVFGTREEAELERAAYEQEDREMSGLEPGEMPWRYSIKKEG